MTKKDYELIARVIERAALASSDRASLAQDFADELELEGGLDLNGNRRFKRDRFLKAAGV